MSIPIKFWERPLIGGFMNTTGTRPVNQIPFEHRAGRYHFVCARCDLSGPIFVSGGPVDFQKVVSGKRQSYKNPVALVSEFGAAVAELINWWTQNIGTECNGYNLCNLQFTFEENERSIRERVRASFSRCKEPKWLEYDGSVDAWRRWDFISCNWALSHMHDDEEVQFLDGRYTIEKLKEMYGDKK